MFKGALQHQPKFKLKTPKKKQSKRNHKGFFKKNRFKSFLTTDTSELFLTSYGKASIALGLPQRGILRHMFSNCTTE